MKVGIVNRYNPDPDTVSAATAFAEMLAAVLASFPFADKTPTFGGDPEVRVYVGLPFDHLTAEIRAIMMEEDQMFVGYVAKVDEEWRCYLGTYNPCPSQDPYISGHSTFDDVRLAIIPWVARYLRPEALMLATKYGVADEPPMVEGEE